MDIGNIIYLVIVVVYVLYTFVDNFIGKQKGKTNEDEIVLPNGEIIRPQTGPSIEERLEDYLNPDRVRTTPRTQQEELSYEEEYDEYDGYDEYEEDIPETPHSPVIERQRPSSPKKAKHVPAKREIPKTNTTTDSIADAIERTKDEEMSRIYDINKMEDGAEEEGFEFNMRDMIIYETIMRRKY